MQGLDKLLDEAKAAENLKSDRQLCDALGLKHPAVSHWRAGRTLPSDEAIVKLAMLAGHDPAEALLNLNVHKSEGMAQEHWKRIKSSFKAANIALALGPPLTFGAALTIQQLGSVFQLSA